MRRIDSKQFLCVILISFFTFSVVQVAWAETGLHQDTVRISAYAIAAEGEYVYILGDAVNLEGQLDGDSLDLGGGMRDIWLVKLRGDGTLVYTALIGGGDNDSAYSIAVREGVVYILGETWSWDFPGAPGNAGENDALLLALAADGSQILWARRFGGSDQDSGRALILHDESLFLTGITWSQDLVAGAAQGNADGFLARVRLNGTLEWLKIFGGSALDAPFDLARIGDTLWVAGQSYSRDFGGTHQGEGDAFAASFNLAGVEQSAWLYGGREEDISYAISPAEDGSILLAGGTRTSTFSDAQGEFAGSFDGFLMNLSAGGDLISVNYLGGTGIDYVYDIQTLPSGEVLVVGETFSPEFPLGYGKAQETFGEGDAFIVRFNPGSDEATSWVKGGSGTDRARDVALVSEGVWLAGQFSLGELPYGLFISQDELGEMPLPEPQTSFPTATLALTATLQPTETPRPTSTPTPVVTETSLITDQPADSLTGTVAVNNTATDLAAEATSTALSGVAEEGTPSEPGQTETEAQPTSDVATSTEEELPGETKDQGGSTGLIVGLGVLLVAGFGGAYYVYRRNKHVE
jgi:hypothetical protein